MMNVNALVDNLAVTCEPGQFFPHLKVIRLRCRPISYTDFQRLVAKSGVQQGVAFKGDVEIDGTMKSIESRAIPQIWQTDNAMILEIYHVEEK